jgi:GT2 family glycosyltransferase
VSSLCVVLLTYNRFDYAVRTLRSTLDNIRLGGDLELNVHIASDGDPPDYIDELVGIARYNYFVKEITTSNSKRGGYGANYNLATSYAHPHNEYSLLLEDDWELNAPLKVANIIDGMQRYNFGCARVGRMGYTYEVRCVIVGTRYDFWLRLDPASIERHVFSGHPRIESREWSRKLGAWPTGLNPGETEVIVANRPASREDVGWPISLVPLEGLYEHIGLNKSYAP